MRSLFLMIRRPPRSTPDVSSAASDVYKRQGKTVLMFDENLKGVHLSQAKIKPNSEILVVIGPEGGFEEEERAFISDSSKNFFNVSLGPNILKADTAVIAALSLTFHYFS